MGLLTDWVRGYTRLVGLTMVMEKRWRHCEKSRGLIWIQCVLWLPVGMVPPEAGTKKLLISKTQHADLICQ
jgi:hypothetical protein